MYYKVENKESSVYKKLHALRSRELLIEEENKQAIKDKTGLDFQEFLGHQGQQTFSRVTEYHGFRFLSEKGVQSNIWNKHKEIEGVFVPNNRTKAGREMANFLANGLKKSNFQSVLSILGCEDSINGRFTFPYVHIAGDIIILFLSNSCEPKDDNVIEITKKEFNEIFDEKNQ